MEVLTEETFDNRHSTVPLTQTFEVSKRMMETSVFGKQHGFEVGFGVEATFTAKIPVIGESETTVAFSTTTSHTWNLETTNEVEHTFTRSSVVDVPAGQAIKKTASVTSCTLDMPYEASIMTMYGCKTTIRGIWNGVLYSHLTVTQTDI
ncbi:aerolysin-like protein [Gastrophryne carolinensis]